MALSDLPPELQEIYKKSREALEDLTKGLDRLAETPSAQPAVTQSVSDQRVNASSGYGPISISDRIMVRNSLREINQKANGEQMLWSMFNEQAARQDVGVPLHSWLNAGGYSTQKAFEGINSQVDPAVAKALDSTGASALIRQDLEPFLYELYVRNFPAFDRIRKIPANGLVHAYNQITSYGDAEFMAELGTVSDDKSTYNRATTNIAIAATRRGVSLKSQFAVIQGGAGYNPEMLELRGGLRAVAHKVQKQMFSGTATDSGGLTTNEFGAYEVNGFDGLRYLLRSNPTTQNVDPATNPTTTGAIRNAVNFAATQSSQSGGNPGILWGHPEDKLLFDQQQDANVRYMAPENLMGVSVGVVTNAINTINGPIPFAIVPGDAIGTYNYTGSSYTTARDLYLLDENGISMPYLGSEGPTVLDIPIGIAGQLTHLFVIFGMWGLSVEAPSWQRKVRIKKS